jgi:hypothetical protein
VQFSSAATSTSPIDVRGADEGLPLIHENTLCSKPNPQTDAESLTYVAKDDSFWLTDDNRPSIFQVDRTTGAFLSRVPADSIVAALPTAGACDDADGDPTTACSYVGEFEHIAYDPQGQLLYVLNTVSRPKVDPGKDRTAVFTLRRSDCAGCLSPEDWHEMPSDYNGGPLTMIEGVPHVGRGKGLYPYDFADNVLTVTKSGDSLPPAFEASARFRGVHHDGTYLWILLASDWIVKVDWLTRAEVEQHDLAPFGIGAPRGIQVVGGQIYILDGEWPNPIYVFGERSP